MPVLSKFNREIIDVNDEVLMTALVEKFGHTCKTCKYNRDSWMFSKIDDTRYTRRSAGHNRAIEIINENSTDGVINL
jgi:hypothetical protein